MMFKQRDSISLTLCLLIVASNCNFGWAFKDYEKVRSFLNKLGRNKPASTYFSAIEDKLKQIESNFFSRTRNLFFKAALEDIAKLNAILNDPNPKCNAEEYFTLFDTRDYSAAHKYFNQEQVTKLTPLDSIVFLVSSEHALRCRNVYYAKFQTEYSLYDEREKLCAEFKRQSFENLSNGQRSPIDIKVLMEYLVNYNFTGDSESAPDAYQHLKSLSESDDHKCNFNMMYQKYLYKPCKNYDEKLGQPILSPARLDSQMFPGNTFYNFDDVHLLPFYMAMASNKACNYLIHPNIKFSKKVETLWQADRAERCKEMGRGPAKNGPIKALNFVRRIGKASARMDRTNGAASAGVQLGTRNQL